MPRILLITYAFPPMSGPTELRWLRLLIHLSSLGWTADVVSADFPRGYLCYDNFTTESIPPNVQVHRVYPGILDQYFLPINGSTNQTSRSNRRLLKTLAIPDRYAEWIPQAVSKAVSLAKKHRYDVLVSSSYPFTSHLVALAVKKLCDLPWLGDLSDPYSANPENHWLPQWRRRLDVAIERRTVSAMDSICVPTGAIADYVASIVPTKAEKIVQIGYGYDESLFDSLEALELPRDVYNLVYTGVFYTGIRNPLELFKAIRLVRDFPVHLHIAGPMDEEVRKIVTNLSIESRVSFLGQVSKTTAIRLQKGGDALVLLGNKGGMQLPGKVYEYLATGNPIICIKNDIRDLAAELVEDEGHGVVVPNSAEDIARAIIEAVSRWKMPSGVRKDVARFSFGDVANRMALHLATLGRVSAE